MKINKKKEDKTQKKKNKWQNNKKKKPKQKKQKHMGKATVISPHVLEYLLIVQSLVAGPGSTTLIPYLQPPLLMTSLITYHL